MAPTERTPSSSCGDVLSDSFNVGRFAWDFCAATSDAAEQLEWKQPGTAEEKDALQPGDHVIALVRLRSSHLPAALNPYRACYECNGMEAVVNNPPARVIGATLYRLSKGLSLHFLHKAYLSTR